MSKATIVLLVALLAAPMAFAAKRVTVEQLSREVASLSKKKDAKVAGRLYGLELTQRLSAKKLAALEAKLPGPKSRQALVALADQSEFLDPPPAEIPNKPAPSFAEQRAIIARSITYVEGMLKRFPNLFARRDTIRYEDIPAGVRSERTNTIIPYRPLHPVSRTIAKVLYRDGKEIVQREAAQQGGKTVTTGMITFGEFGPLFSVLYGDLPKGNLRWGYWEQGKSGLEAVFRFNVPKADSHYLVRYCCIDHSLFKQFPAYHGEITIDPSKGTILRVTLIADMAPEDPMTRSELMVEYGPVKLGGKKYFCPARGVSISRAPVREAMYGTTGGYDARHSQMQTMLNETVFNDYHLFRGDVQILTANNAKGESQTAPAKASSESSAFSAEFPTEQANAVNENAGSASAAVGTAGKAEASSAGAAKSAAPPATTPQLNASAAAPSASPTVEPASPVASAAAKAEASSTTVAKSATPPPAMSAAAPASPSGAEVAGVAPGNIPQTPVPPPPASGKSGFSLSLNARLVDVDVTAVDKKGRPIMGLTKNDFVIYDNGKKQALRSFSPVGSAPVRPQSGATAAQAVLYTNLPAAVGSGGAQAAGASAPESSTILLLDPTSLNFPDLNYAREQILKFLKRLPSSEPVGLYVRAGLGFRILAKETTDHTALSAALRKWMPSAKDLANAQEAEMRNRQQFDTVGNNAATAGDEMAGLNGSMIMPGSGLPVPDPKRMQEGGVDPARATFGVLVGVASHLKAIPGHKNLVWVASDNVLVNWSYQTLGANIGNSRIGGAGMRAQEAMNDAHVSIYPLDASQLEAGGTNASLQNSSAELSSAAATMAPHANDEIRMKGGRAQAAMLQDMHAIQPSVQQAAQATGGRAFPRASDMIRELNSVVADGNAAYLLSFSPDTVPDGKYHRITVKVPGRRGIKLRYRAGYLYTKEPTTLKERIRQAVWQPQDETGIGINARWTHASEGAAISLSIAAGDVSVKKQQDRWTDKLDIFLVQLDDTGIHATVKEQTLALNVTPATYQNLLRNGIPFAEHIEHPQATGTVRVIVVDENSGRMGSVTLPAMAESATR